jgi:hypothetical protein
LADFGDYWVRYTSAVPLKPGDSFVALSRVEEPNKIRLQNPTLLENIETLATSVLAGCAAYDVTECRIREHAREDLVLVRDRVSVRQTAPNAICEWIGGICVNRKSFRYLREALPDKIRFSDREFPLTELLSVNRLPFTFSRFRAMLASEQTDASYEVEFPDRLIASLSVGVRRILSDDRLGFVVSENGTIAPFVNWIPSHRRALIGHEEPDAHFQREITLSSCVGLISNLMAQWPQSASESQTKEIEAAISTNSVPTDVRRFLIMIEQRANAQRNAISAVEDK